MEKENLDQITKAHVQFARRKEIVHKMLFSLLELN